MSLQIAPPENRIYYRPDEWKRIEQQLMARFYRLRNDGPSGERMWCRWHPFTVGVSAPTYHDFLTHFCVPTPFTWFGVQHMYATTRVGESRVLARAADGAYTGMTQMRPPDLAAGHPRTARELGAGVPGEQWIAFLLGTAEPIDAWQAQHDADEIRRRQDRARVPAALRFTLQPLRLRNEALRGGANG